MDNIVIALTGESASGKSLIEQKLKEDGYSAAISHTTRPIRPNEINGLHYFYISNEEFLKLDKTGFFAESTIYRDWYYGVSIKELTKDDVVIVCIEPNGLQQIKNIESLNIIPIYIKVSERTRMSRLMNRLDDVDEAIRRLISDRDLFKDIEKNVSYIVENYDLDVTLKNIKNIIKQELYKSKYK